MGADDGILPDDSGELESRFLNRQDGQVRQIETRSSLRIQWKFVATGLAILANLAVRFDLAGLLTDD
jgi:hypothetical protein